MIFFDFSKNIYPNSEVPYFKKVISFVEHWQSGLEIIQINTSGSTGLPKRIDIKRQQMVASAKLTGQYFYLKEGDHAFCCLNVEFVAGMMMLVRAMELKLQITVIEPIGNPFLGMRETNKFDFSALVPLQIQAILENEITRKYLQIHSNIKNIIIGGAAINQQTLKAIQQLNIPCFATYGMTETVSHIALRSLIGEESTEYFNKMKGINLDIDERNCLKIKGLCTDNKWIQTNDIVDLDSKKNSFKLIGRANRVVNSGGIKVYLDIVEKEIENEVYSCFRKNIRYFLFGLNDEKLGEKLSILIEAEKEEFNINIKEMFKYSILDKYKIPKEIFFAKKFEETASGKVDYLNTIQLIK